MDLKDIIQLEESAHNIMSRSSSVRRSEIRENSSQAFYTLSSRHYQELYKELQCGICKNLPVIPHYLLCDHFFCKGCLAAYETKVRMAKQEPTCPKCRKPYTRRNTRPAPHVQSLVDIHMKIREENNICTQAVPFVKYDG